MRNFIAKDVISQRRATLTKWRSNGNNVEEIFENMSLLTDFKTKQNDFFFFSF